MRAALLMLLCALALPAKTFYLTVAGLGGEPEYEQRFAGWAKDLENAEKAGGGLTPRSLRSSGRRRPRPR